MDTFYANCEFAEYIKQNHKLLSSEKARGFRNASMKRFPLLANVKNTRERSNVANHLMRTVYTAFIKELHEEYCTYIKAILKDAALSHKIAPQRILNKLNLSFKPEEVLEIYNYEQLVELITNRVFRAIDEEEAQLTNTGRQNGKFLIESLQKRIGISINNTIINNAVPYLALRHVLVHDDGKPDKDFQTRYPIFKLPSNRTRILLTHKIVSDAYSNVDILIRAIDDEAEKSGLIINIKN